MHSQEAGEGVDVRRGAESDFQREESKVREINRGIERRREKDRWSKLDKEREREGERALPHSLFSPSVAFFISPQEGSMVF